MSRFRRCFSDVAKGLLWAMVALTLCLFHTGNVSAHEVRPALLQITESAPGRYEVLWKQPTVGDMALRLEPQLSSGVLQRSPARDEISPGFRLRRWQVQGPTLDGQTVRIEGLQQSVTDVLLRVTTADGRAIDAVLRPADPSVRLDLAGPRDLAVPAYFRMGFEHILAGIDHLLFVFGLLLLIGPSWRLVKAITAFTAAHTLTLGAAALGYIRFPSAIIEALVALSIVFVACELATGGTRPQGLAQRRPWLIAFVFGLLHGLAFSGALAEIGLPRGAAPQALLLFNLGVEAGQLAFIAAVLGAGWLLSRLSIWRRVETLAWARLAPAYLIGGLSAYWLIERIVTAVQPAV